MSKIRDDRDDSRCESAVPHERRDAYRRAVRGPTIAEHAARMAACVKDANVLLTHGDLLAALGASWEVTVCMLAIAAATPADAPDHRAKIALLQDIGAKLEQSGQHHIAPIVEAALIFELNRDPRDTQWAVGRH